MYDETKHPRQYKVEDADEMVYLTKLLTIIWFQAIKWITKDYVNKCLASPWM